MGGVFKVGNLKKNSSSRFWEILILIFFLLKKIIWRREALALSDRYAHQKFEIDTTPSGDAIRVSRNLETPTYNVKKITSFELTFELLHTALIEKNFKP